MSARMLSRACRSDSIGLTGNTCGCGAKRSSTGTPLPVLNETASYPTRRPSLSCSSRAAASTATTRSWTKAAPRFSTISRTLKRISSGR